MIKIYVSMLHGFLGSHQDFFLRVASGLVQIDHKLLNRPINLVTTLVVINNYL